MLSSGEGDRFEPAASGIGSELRAARERLGWSVEDVALTLRIRHAFLAAIEAGRFDALPAYAYALGFVRSYAALLGLDADAVGRRFRNEARDITGRIPLEFPAPVADRGAPAGAVVLLGVLLAIGSYIGWYRVSGERRSEAVVQTVPDRLAPLALPAPAPPPPPTPAPLAAAPPIPGLPSYPPISAGAAMPPASFTVAPAVAAPPPPSEEGRIVVRAHADSWIQVRDSAGQTLFNRVMRPGETYAVPVSATGKPLLLTTGNAGGVDLLVDGLAAPPLGSNGVVRRDLPLDADTLRKRPAGANP